MAVQIQIRRGTASEWTSSNPILAQGEMGFETDTNKFKFGDGTNNWSALSYASADGGFDSDQIVAIIGEHAGGGLDSDGVITTLRERTDSINIGGNLYSSGANVEYVIAIGNGSNVNTFGGNNLAIGQNANVAAIGNAIAIGARANAGGTGGTAVGRDANASGVSSTALGIRAYANNSSAALGLEANASGVLAVALGRSATASGDRSIALGRNANAIGLYSAAIGSNANASGENSVAIGRNAQATEANVIALGGYGSKPRINQLTPVVDSDIASKSYVDSVAGGGGSGGLDSEGVITTLRELDDSINIGGNLYSSGANVEYVIAIGNGSNVNTFGGGSLAIGRSANVTAQGNAIAIGDFARAGGDGGTAVGDAANASGASSTALGIRAYANNSSAALGRFANASGVLAVALGSYANVSGDRSIVLGQRSNASALNSTAIGSYTNASGENSVAIGRSATASGENSVAIGQSAQATTANTIVLGTSTIDTSIAGALSKGSGTFKIDHPLASKKDTHFLVHSFIEGPSVDNLYRGTMTLTAGSGTTNLDSEAGMTEGTFEALNRNVQVFTTNETGWSQVKGSVAGNILTISAKDSDTPTVSWLVIGQRQDNHIMRSIITDSDGYLIVEPAKDSDTFTDSDGSKMMYNSLGDSDLGM